MDKFKKISMRKALKIGVFLVGLGLIVLMTMVNIGINDKFDFYSWLSGSLIILGIMVFGLILGESMGRDRQIDKVDGLYQKALLSYNEFLASIDGIIIYFTSFYEWYLPQDLEKKKIDYLLTANVKPEKARRIVRYCGMDDLNSLKKGPIKKITQDGTEIIVAKLEEYEIGAVMDVFEGRIKLDASGASYYLSPLGGYSRTGILENGRKLDKQIKFNKNSNRILKLAVSMFVSLVWGLFTINEMGDGDGAAMTMAWFNLVSRICGLLTSFISGWASSAITVRLEAEKIDDKRRVLTIFRDSIDKRLFVPMDEDAMAKEEYERFQMAQTRRMPESELQDIIEQNGREDAKDGEKNNGAEQREQDVPAVQNSVHTT